ncbi:hypothetical protein D3C81_1411010 [compost metagenome]
MKIITIIFMRARHVQTIRPARRQLLRPDLPRQHPPAPHLARHPRHRCTDHWRRFQRPAHRPAPDPGRQARNPAGSQPRGLGRVRPQRRPGAARLVVRHAAARKGPGRRTHPAPVGQHVLGRRRNARATSAPWLRHRLPAGQPVDRRVAAPGEDARRSPVRRRTQVGLRRPAPDRP